MTDKQIIIDGIDVSGCLFYQTNFEEDYDVKIKHYCSNWHNSCESNNNSNCYYKQLLRKEQECRMWKMRHEEFKKQSGRLEAHLATLDAKIELGNAQYKELKAENDKYSLFIEKLCDYAGLDCDSEEQAMRTLSDLASQMNKARWIIDRYKQTLTEIKEICKKGKKIHDDLIVSKEILQKISECEVGDENSK